MILTEDPTAVDPDTIDQIKIAETIKEGVAIYTASPEKLKKADVDAKTASRTSSRHSRQNAISGACRKNARPRS